MKGLKIICDYFLYCGIGKDEYNAVRKDAYVSNFILWRTLHVLMVVAFGFLFVSSLLNDLFKINRAFYLFAFVYSAIALCFFFILKKDSLIS